MHTQEWDELTECRDCGATIAASSDGVFAIDDDEVLCFDCAVRRGGKYDAVQERWTVFPNVSDVAERGEERRAHVPGAWPMHRT